MRMMQKRLVVDVSVRIVLRMHMGMVTVHVCMEEDAGRWGGSGCKEDNQRGRRDAL